MRSTTSLCLPSFCLVLAAAAGLPQQLTAQVAGPCAPQWQVDRGIAGVNGPVHATVLWDPDGAGPASAVLVIGGEFSIAHDIAVNNIASWDPATEVWQPLGSGMDGAVLCLAVRPSGELIVGGSFTNAGTTPASSIATYNGAWSSLGSGTDGIVRAIAVLSNGNIAAGGEFTRAGGVGAANIALWDGGNWTTLGAGATAPVTTLATAPNGNLVAIGITSATEVAQWNGTAWSSIGAPFPFSPAVTLFSRANGNLLAGGGVSVAQWNGVQWTALGPNVPFTVKSLSQTSSGVTFVVGGSFGSTVARLNGASWSPIGTSTGLVNTLCELPSGDVVAGGDFWYFGNLQANRLARWDGASWLPVANGFDHGVRAIHVLPTGEIVVGGNFQVLDGIRFNCVAMKTGTTWTTMGLGFDNFVGDITSLPNGDIVAVGAFTQADGQPANSVARWDGSNWQAVGQGVPFSYLSEVVVLPNGHLVVAGVTVSGPHILEWDGVSWQPVGGGVSSSVKALLVMPNGDLVVGGSFFFAGGNTLVNNIARWDGQAWSAFGSGLNGQVESLALAANGDLLAAGLFAAAGTQPAVGIARWNGTSWQPVGAGLAGYPTALTTLPNGDIVAAELLPKRLSRFDGSTWSTMETFTGTGVVDEMVTAGSTIYVGGQLTVDRGGVLSSHFVRLETPCPATAIDLGAGCASSGGSNTLSATPPWIGATVTETATGLPSMAIAVVVRGFASIGIPLSSVLSQAPAGCTLAASPDAIDLALAIGGTATSQWVAPNSPALVGASLYSQFVVLELDASLGILAATSTNTIAHTIGSF